jgi:antitoxin (DNA-binding transcriptional repressor) of toxin-antitoxin stability system
MAERVIHISEAEAASDFAGVLARVRAGAEVVIENGTLPVAVIHAPLPPRRSISECIALLPEDSTATVDAEFARDVEAAIESHRKSARAADMGMILDSSLLVVHRVLAAGSSPGFQPGSE